MLNKRFYLIISTFITILFLACTATYKPLDASIAQANVKNIKTPVFKRENLNPVVHISINAVQPIRLNQIELLLNDAAIKNFARIDLYSTDTSGKFSDSVLVTSVVPNNKNTALNFDGLPVVGKRNYWVNVVLKDNADIDDKVLVKVNKINTSDNKFVTFAEQGDYTYRLGIALRKPNDDGSHSYRIPGLINTDKGSLIAVYDIRYEHPWDLPANIDVGMSKSTDGGHSWLPMQNIMDMGEPHKNNGVGDPAILFDPATKTLWTSALWSKGNRSIHGSLGGISPDSTGQFVLVSSTDDGKTWSQPYTITPQIKNPKWKIFFNGPGNGIAMQDGTLVFAAQYWDENNLPWSTIVYSKDHGKTWHAGIGAKSNTTEAQVIETTPGTIMISMRDNRGKFRSVATTTDFGATWKEHPTSYSVLKDPVCMASFIKANVNTRVGKRDVVFFSNPNHSSKRVDMTIKASLDLAESWQENNQLLIDEREGFGYSCMTPVDDNTIGIFYEGIRYIYFMRIPVTDIVK